MSEQEYQNSVQEAGPGDILGSTDHEQHRAPAGEGQGEAPLAEKGAENAQYSVFDGKGNEQVVVVADDPEGRKSEGVGATAEEALGDATGNTNVIGDDFGSADTH